MPLRLAHAARTARWAVALIAALAAPAAADPPDSLARFLEGLSDSTDAYFGSSAAPVDTAGLDSSLAFHLEHPELSPRPRVAVTSFGPWLSFDRADGPRWGAAATLGDDSWIGALHGRLGYAAGPGEWRGEGGYTKRWGARRARSPRWTFRAGAGRLTETLDPDHAVPWIRLVRAFVLGSDREHSLRRDGFRASLARATRSGRAAIGFRAHLESPLAATTTWSLFRRPVLEPDNRPAARGRVRELLAEAGARVPRTPLQVEASLAAALEAMGGDFAYRRARLAGAGEWPIGGVASAIVQGEYGRLAGDPVPQASFFLGGAASLRSLAERERGGTVEAMTRLDLVFTPDLLALARLPHPDALILQGALFAGAGAVSGPDPYGGAGSAERDWPARREWRSEVGGSLLYRPGLPDPTGYFRLDYAHPLGPGERGRWSLAFWKPLGLLRSLE